MATHKWRYFVYAGKLPAGENQLHGLGLFGKASNMMTAGSLLEKALRKEKMAMIIKLTVEEAREIEKMTGGVS